MHHLLSTDKPATRPGLMWTSLFCAAALDYGLEGGKGQLLILFTTISCGPARLTWRANSWGD
jgi:hypothetical protein